MKFKNIICSLSIAIVAFVLLGSVAYSIPGKHRMLLGGSISGQGSVGVSWSLWDEIAEGGLNTSQETANDTHCMFAENAIAAGNETGIGIATGLDLVWTQGNNVPGATGSPPRRALATNRYFDFTNGLATFVKGADKKWFICLKWSDVTTRGMYIDMYSVASFIRIYYDGNKLFLQSSAGNATSADDTPTSGAMYVYAWCDGTTTKAAFATGKKTKLSEFDAGKVVSIANAFNFSAVTFTSASIGIYSTDHTTGPVTGNLFYVVFSKACLIDNAS